MSTRNLKRATGNWVVGEQFWDREIEMDLFLERLFEGKRSVDTVLTVQAALSLSMSASLRKSRTYTLEGWVTGLGEQKSKASEAKRWRVGLGQGCGPSSRRRAVQSLISSQVGIAVDGTVRLPVIARPL